MPRPSPDVEGGVGEDKKDTLILETKSLWWSQCLSGLEFKT